MEIRVAMLFGCVLFNIPMPIDQKRTLDQSCSTPGEKKERSPQWGRETPDLDFCLRGYNVVAITKQTR